MGGQACVLYGAAEFSRDTDLAILADAGNLDRLRNALADPQAEVIAVPPLRLNYLRRGHAVHFRCQHPEAFRIRIHVMSQMRGVDPFFHRLVSNRPLLIHALSGKLGDLGRELLLEQQAEQAKDRLYWQPLRESLERLRRQAS